MQSISLKRQWFIVLLGVLIILYLFLPMDKYPSISLKYWFSSKPRNVRLIDILSSMDVSKTDCTELIGDWSKHNLSEEYYRLLPQFKSSLEAAINKAPEAEGHSGQLPVMTQVLHMIASSSVVKVVCETGFNYGHSSYNFLSANQNLKVHSFDIGLHHYAEKMFISLQKIFKDRISVHFGDSTLTIPNIKGKDELPLCDLIFVDGGHTYPVARADLLNFGSNAHADNLVIFDDYPTGWGANFGKAWDELLVRGGDKLKVRPLDANEIKHKSHEELGKVLGIEEYVRCSIRGAGLERGFVVGKYVLRG